MLEKDTSGSQSAMHCPNDHVLHNWGPTTFAGKNATQSLIHFWQTCPTANFLGNWSRDTLLVSVPTQSSILSRQVRHQLGPDNLYTSMPQNQNPNA